jgi:hypothetical protein
MELTDRARRSVSSGFLTATSSMFANAIRAYVGGS